MRRLVAISQTEPTGLSMFGIAKELQVDMKLSLISPVESLCCIFHEKSHDIMTLKRSLRHRSDDLKMNKQNITIILVSQELS